MKKAGGLRAIFAVPLLLATVSIAGLVVALTGDGWRCRIVGRARHTRICRRLGHAHPPNLTNFRAG